jgi:hypothetical protein
LLERRSIPSQSWFAEENIHPKVGSLKVMAIASHSWPIEENIHSIEKW